MAEQGNGRVLLTSSIASTMPGRSRRSTTFEALMKGERRVVAASLMVKSPEAMAKVLPDRVEAAAHRLQAEPKDTD